MSWAGFKKNVNRATTQVMMKTGHVERTNDRDYEVEERSDYYPVLMDRRLTGSQTVSYYGSSSEQITEGGQGLPRQSERSENYLARYVPMLTIPQQ